MRKLTKDDVIQFCALNNLKFCSDNYIGAEYKYKFKCENGHIFERKYGNLTQNKICPTCRLDNRKYYNKLTIEKWAQICKNKNITILSREYKNARTALNFKCDICECIFSNSPCNIKAGSGCPKCKNGSSNLEEEVRKIFEFKFNEKFPTVRLDSMKNPVTKMNLELDGYCEKLNLAFEYDGEFHYKENPYRKDALNKQKALDTLKDSLCKNNGITLIRIPYTQKDNLKGYIDSKLKESKYECK